LALLCGLGFLRCAVPSIGNVQRTPVQAAGVAT